jgi:hypothetical protein
MVETEWRSLCVGKAALRQYILDTSRLLDGLILNPVGQEGCRDEWFFGFPLFMVRSSFQL